MKRLLHILILLAVICLVVAASGCTNSESNKATATPTPKIVPTTAAPAATSVMSNLANIANLAPGEYSGEDGSVITVHDDHSYDIKTKDGTLSYDANGKMKVTVAEGGSYSGDENSGKITNPDGSVITWEKIGNGLVRITDTDGSSYELPESALASMM